MVDENSAAGKAGVNAKEDWFHKSNCSDISTKNLLMSMVLTDLANLNQKKITEKTLKQKQFSNSYGSEAKMRFDQAYDNSKKRVCQLSARQYQRSQTGHELLEKT
jgi:hypothetical protein